MMRKLLNILAVIIGLMGAVGAVAGGVVFVIGVISLFGASSAKPDGLTPVYGLGVSGGMAFLCGLIASRALLHLRQPDAGTARDMIGTAVYLIVILAVFPLLKGSAWVLPIIIGLYLLHRFLAKRVAVRAFPAALSS